MAARIRSLTEVLLAGAILTLLGCQAQLKPSEFGIGTYIIGVTDASGTISGTLHQGQPPGSNGGPSVSVTGFAAMVTGGSAQQTLTGGAAFTRVVVAMAGTSDYYDITLPSGSSNSILLRAATNLPNMNLPVQYAVGDANTIGAYSGTSVRVIRVGTGDVQVSVAWSDTSDVDLHVVDPNGEEIYYGHKSSASGGTLDLDSNAACSRDVDNTHRSNENVVWPLGGGAHGTYTVRLDYWSSCAVTANTQYVVTVSTAGSATKVFTGSFSGTGDGGGSGSGTQITTFSF